MNAPLAHRPDGYTFASPADFVEWRFGPRQHDAHVFAYWRAGGKTPYQRQQAMLRDIAAWAVTPDRRA